MDTLSKEELISSQRKGKIKMILGIVFLAVSFFSSFVFGIVGGILGLYNRGEALIGSVGRIVFAICGFVIIGGLYGSGIPLLIVGIVTKVKSANRLKRFNEAANTAPSPNDAPIPSAQTD